MNRHVRPPWFRTSVFYATPVGLFVVMLVGSVRWRTQPERRQVERLQLEINARMAAEQQFRSSQPELDKRE